MPNHIIWFTLTIGCVAWYTIVTSYVAVRGFADIKFMLRELEKMKNEERSAP